MAKFLRGLFDVASTLLCAVVVVLVATPQAHAYVDPSVMTYTIQAVAGVAVALSAVLGVALRRTRRVIFRVFKIDENANKVVEPPVMAVNPWDPQGVEQKVQADALAIADKEELLHGRAAKRLKWPTRFVRALVVSVFFVLTFFVASSLEIVAGASSSLNFTFMEVEPLVLAVGGGAALVLALVLSLFRGRAFDVLLALVAALTVAAYIQALFLNQGLPIADGTGLDLGGHLVITIISALVWVAIVVIFLILNAKKKAAFRAGALLVSVALIVVQGVSLASVHIDKKNDAGEIDYTITSEGLWDVGSDSNVIVVVLDMFDTDIMNRLLELEPDLKDIFQGFTYYPNSVGSMIPTRYGIPYLLSGSMPKPGQSFQEYLDTRYDKSTLISDIKDQGYDVGIYSDSILVYESENRGSIIEDTTNIVPRETVQLNYGTVLAVLAKMSLYRELPWTLKPLCWFTTDEVNRGAIVDTVAPFYMDDAAYFEKLSRDGISIGENKKTFRFIHLIGAHWPYILDETGRLGPKEGTDQLSQSEGVLRRVGEYFNQMKELGIYNEATIIVTADHGYWSLNNGDLETPSTPILLVKPSGGTYQSRQPLKISSVPTGHLDIPPTIIEGIGGDPKGYGTTVFEVTEGARPRYYWTTASDGSNDYAWIEYEINGDVLDINNWQKTGNEIEIPQ